MLIAAGGTFVTLRLKSLVIYGVLLGMLPFTCQTARAQDPETKQEKSVIQDNSFLIEEAYNQERGVVQHISTFSRMWNSKDWSYTFTQEWPVPRHWRNQLSYTVVAMHAGDYRGSSGGFGDVILNYRYQIVGDGESRLAIAPRVSMLLPTGDVATGRGAGGAGVQINLPASLVLHRRLVSHWNAGSTFVPNAQDDDHCRANTVGYNVGQSFVYLLNPRVNLLLETVHTRFQSVIAPAKTQWAAQTYVSPGIRWAYNFKNGLQIVPGMAMPIGIGSSAGERGLILYLSFEHPFRTGEGR